MRTQSHPFRITATVAATGLVLAQLLPQRAVAQTFPPPPLSGSAQDQQPAGDPPARVGRLARVIGTVSYHTQDDSQWSPATANYPVTAGNAFWTEPNAQADIEVSASRVTMAPGTELDVATLDDTSFQAGLPQGESYFRIRSARPGETYAVQTPRGLVTLSAPGRYAVAAGDTQTPTLVTVIDGAAQVSGPGLSLQVGPDQTATITGSDAFQAEVGPAQRDPFVSALLDRDRPPPAQAVAPPPSVAAMPGGEDLAQYGTWADSPEYGQVWYPQVAPDWVPYRDGHWAYVEPWGWTWVDSDPWGFAPFHYGRWAEIGGRWGWYPGAETSPYYAPALVTFFGIGAVVGIGVGAVLAEGRVGWFPLGPREAYRPWYHASDRYMQRVNTGRVTNFTTINNFANRHAATVVPASALTASRPVRPVFQRVDPAQLGQARPIFGQQPLRPTLGTAGVTPAVARRFDLRPAPGPAFQHSVAPGPAIRPAGLVPGAGPGVRPPLAVPHAAPLSQTVPASAGARPFIGQPQGGAPGAITPRPGGPAFGGPATQQGLPALRNPVGPASAVPPPVQHVPGNVGPASVAHPFAAPGVAGPSGGPQPGPHVGPAPVSRPMPQLANPGTPQVFHPNAPPAVNAPASPQIFRPHPATPPQAAFHPPPPQQQQPAFHAPPPVQAFHPPPQVQSPPPQVHVAAPPQFHPPPQAQFRPPPQPQFHPAPPPQVQFHPAPPPQVHVSAPAPASRPAPAAAQRQKKPGEP